MVHAVMRGLALTVIFMVLPLLAAQGRAVPAIALAETTCDTPLTLTLHPGLHYKPVAPYHAITIKPASDIPTTKIVVHLPVYPDAVPLKGPKLLPGFSYPGTPYLQSAIAQYRTPASPDAVFAWYRDAFLACGYTVGGTGTSTTGKGYQSEEIWFRSSTNPSFQPRIVTGSDRAGGSIILVAAMQVTLPPRPPKSYLPDDITQVRIRYNNIYSRPAKGLMKPPYRLLTSSTDIHTLVNAVNSLSDIDGVVHSCLADRGQGAWLDFVRGNGKYIRVLVHPACYDVVVGKTRALWDTNWTVWKAVQSVKAAATKLSL